MRLDEGYMPQGIQEPGLPQDLARAQTYDCEQWALLLPTYS